MVHTADRDIYFMVHTADLVTMLLLTFDPSCLTFRDIFGGMGHSSFVPEDGAPLEMIGVSDLELPILDVQMATCSKRGFIWIAGS